MSEQAPLHTPLHDRHVALEARMGDEAGWSVPLSYVGPLEEARRVRGGAGLFDVSHSGRIRIRGDGALGLLERACTADVARQEDDAALPTLLCNERGGILDLSRLLRLEGAWLLLTSPPCREKVLSHLRSLAGQFDAKVDDQTFKTVQLLAAGPGAAELLDPVLPVRASDLPDGAVRTGSFLVARYAAVRSGPGLWGLEVVIPNLLAGAAWDYVTKKAGDCALAPAGLAALDVLRVEAGLPRYGHELNETVDPFTAGLSRLIDFGHDFLGRPALEELRTRPPARRLVGLLIEAPDGPPPAAAVPRQGAAVLRTDGMECGTVTSGTFSPTMDGPIALAYVGADEGAADTPLLVDTPAGQLRATASALPLVQK